MMMSKHETALALIDEQIEKVEREKVQAAVQVETAQTALNRAEKEVQLIDYSLKELYDSRSSLMKDRTPVEDKVSPSPYVA
jgi:chromosome segregation ATPase